MASFLAFLSLAITALLFLAPTASAMYDDELAVNRSRTVVCTNKAYSTCFMTRLPCPSQCRTFCFMDCSICRAVCVCNKPGGVCQDPRFIGGDGITFYFHGKKDADFCIVTDTNLHINAHFIGKAKPGDRSRDFTWVQSIAVLFDDHVLYVGARRTVQWDPNSDRLDLAFDSVPISLPTTKGSRWESPTAPLAVTRTSDVNGITLELAGRFAIRAAVVPISKKESLVHHYGVGEDDCFAHLDLGFKFYDLTDDVGGVLGKTYSRNYVSNIQVGSVMPVMGGEREFFSPSLFSTGCKASRFTGVAPAKEEATSMGNELEGVHCMSGIGGRGMVCKR